MDLHDLSANKSSQTIKSVAEREIKYLQTKGLNYITTVQNYFLKLDFPTFCCAKSGQKRSLF